MLLETAANLRASRRQANDFFAFFSIFELGGITERLMTGPAENRETKLTVSLGASRLVIKVAQNTFRFFGDLWKKVRFFGIGTILF